MFFCRLSESGAGFLCGIDGSYFLPYPHINAKAVPEALRSLQCQFFVLLDHTSGHSWHRIHNRRTAYDHRFHLAPSTIAAISDFGRQPTDLATAFPSLNTTSMGMLDT